MDLQPGQVVQEKYRIVRLIGEGGMGAVYEGENIAIARRVAIKVMHAAAALSQDMMQRFQREAQAAGRIGNDHILEVLDLGTLPDGDKLMVMEYLDGEPFSARIKRLGHMTPQQLAPLVTQLLDGLGAAHDAQIIHRDLKPDNIFIVAQKAGRTDFLKIIDFGISKFNVLNDETGKMTATGAVMGTPYYMSPEQAKGDGKVDHRSDLYSVGVILYEAITGSVPFTGETFNQLMFKIVLADLTPPREAVPDLDPAFESIITKSMARDPDHRFQTAAEMKAAVEAWASSGVGVTQPPAEKQDPKVLAGVAAEPGPATTGGNWASTQTDAVPAPPTTNTGLVIGATVAGILLLGGGALLAFTGSDDSSEEAAEEAEASASPAAAPPAEEPKKVDEPAVTPADEKPKLEETKAAPKSEPKPVTAKPTVAAPKPATSKPAPPKPVAPKPKVVAPRPKPAAPPRPKPPPKPKETDYGY